MGNWTFVAALSLVSVVAGCGGDPTEVMVVISSDMAFPAEVDGIGIEVMEEDGALVVERELALEEAAMPVSFGVVSADSAGDPEGGSLGFSTKVSGDHFRANASAMLGGTILFTTRATTGFTDGETMRLDMFLASDCRATECDPSESCSDAGCADPYVDPTDLPKWDG